MRHEPVPARGARPPGRGPKVRAVVLAATLSELTETGYAGLTVDNVARRSGVHKTTIYRRWKDRESLVADAVTNLATARVPFPDTHDITADLRKLARSFVKFLNSPAGKAIPAAVLSDAARIPEIAAARRRFFEDLFRRAEPVISGAIARGELPARTDQPSLSESFSHRSTCGFWSPPSQSMKTPPITLQRRRSPPHAAAHLA